MSSDNIDGLMHHMRAFAQARDWEQFHSPKNLAMAMIAECAEVVEHFQWLTEDQSYRLDDRKKEEVRLELADVFIFLMRLADRLQVDLVQAAYDKAAINEKRYPADRVRGDARRASEYEGFDDGQ